MKRKFLAQIAATALAVGATSDLPSLAAGQTTPPMGGGYKDVIPIPVGDPTTNRWRTVQTGGYGAVPCRRLHEWVRRETPSDIEAQAEGRRVRVLGC